MPNEQTKDFLREGEMPDTIEPMSKEKAPTETVRIPSPMVRRINRLASHKDKSVPQFLAEVLAPIVDQLEAKMLDEIATERSGGSAPPRAKRDK